MRHLEVPLQHRTLWATGDVLLRAELRLLLKDNAGQWRAATFLVDSGSEMTTMPAWLAKQRDLPMPRKAATGAIHTQTGLELRAGLLRARIVGLDGTEFTFPCFFFRRAGLARLVFLPGVSESCPSACVSRSKASRITSSSLA